MKKLIFWTMVMSGVGAAYLMYKRGVPLGTIALDTVRHPLGSLASELQTAL